MRQLFTTYKLALILKEKGFNKPCIAEYIDDGLFTIYNQDISGMDSHPEEDEQYMTYCNSNPNWNSTHFKCCAPMYQQVIDWLREDHNINVSVSNCDNDISSWDYRLLNVEMSEDWNLDYDSIYDNITATSYYSALDLGILHALEFIKNEQHK